MENIKLFATPEAYEMLTSADCDQAIQSAVESTIKIALSKKRRPPDHFIEGSPLALSAYWADSRDEESIILIYKHDGFPAFYCIDYEEFFELIKRSLPLSLV